MNKTNRPTPNGTQISSENTTNIYDMDELMTMLVDDEIDPREEAFIRGINSFAEL